jgi:hypothetical protein
MSTRGNVAAAFERGRVPVSGPELVPVPEATAMFSIVKILTTAMGKAVSDVRDLARDPLLAVLVGVAAVTSARDTPLCPTAGTAQISCYDIVAQPKAVRRRIGLVF